MGCGNETAAGPLPRCRPAVFAASVACCRHRPAGMTEPGFMDKPSRPIAKPLRELVGKVVGETFTRQGFASAELVTRWSEIVGARNRRAQRTVKIQWPRADEAGEETAGHAGVARRRAGGDRNSASRRCDLRARQPLSRLARRERGWRCGRRRSGGPAAERPIADPKRPRA